MKPAVDNGTAVNSRCEQNSTITVHRADIVCDKGYETDGADTITIECDPKNRNWTTFENCTSKKHYSGLQSDKTKKKEYDKNSHSPLILYILLC